MYTLLSVWYKEPWNLLFFLLYLTLFFWNSPTFSSDFVALFLSHFLFLSSEFPFLFALTLFFQFFCSKSSYVNCLYMIDGILLKLLVFFPFYVDIRKYKLSIRLAVGFNETLCSRVFPTGGMGESRPTRWKLAHFPHLEKSLSPLYKHT